MEQLKGLILDIADKQMLVFTLLLKYDPQLANFFAETLKEFVDYPVMPEHTRDSARELLQVAQSCLKKTETTESEPTASPPPQARKERPEWLQFVISNDEEPL